MQVALKSQDVDPRRARGSTSSEVSMPLLHTIFRSGPSLASPEMQIDREHTLGAAAIVRDEERTIRRCIDSLVETDVDEILIVDTGSTDRTREIVQEYGDPRVTLHEAAWSHSFASARNQAIELSSCDWIFFIDADEWVISPGHSLKSTVRGATARFGASCVFAPCIVEDETGTAYLDIPRIIHVDTVRFHGSIHEYPIIAADPKTLPGLVGLDIRVAHDGYSNEVVEQTQKVARNLQLLDDSLEREPRNPRLLFHKLRDGLSVLDKDGILSCLASFDGVFTSKDGDPHSPAEYRERARVCAIDRLIVLGAWTDALLVCAALDERGVTPHPDAEYFRGVSDIHFHDGDTQSLLRLIRMRKNSQFLAKSHLDTSGRQLDAVIAAQLFRLRGSEDANAYLSLCEPWTDGFFDASVWRGEGAQLARVRSLSNVD